MHPDNRPSSAASIRALLAYLALGTLFGIVLTKSEVISWFRIQEMFRFQAFHMYGIIGSAVIVAFIGLQLIRRLGARTIDGAAIVLPPKMLGTGTRYWLGGTLFGLGWALVGACPGPLFALLGNGVAVIHVPASALAMGTRITAIPFPSSANSGPGQAPTSAQPSPNNVPPSQ